MRHLGSIVLSVIFAPVIYVLTGYGMVRLEAAQGLQTNWTDAGIGGGALVVAGALYAILVLARLSPLGPLIAALLYLGIQTWALVTDQAKIMSTLGNSVLGIHGAAEAPLPGGVTLLLAIPLLATIFSPRRWRGKDKLAVADGYAPLASGYPQPASPQVGGPQLTDAQPTDAQPDAPAFGEPESAHTYVPPDAPTYAPAPAPATYPESTYSQPAYPQPTSAAPTYAPVADGTVPQPTTSHAAAPQQTTPENAGDANTETGDQQ
jgi:hypothetical protein